MADRAFLRENGLTLRRLTCSIPIVADRSGQRLLGGCGARASRHRNRDCDCRDNLVRAIHFASGLYGLYR